ncbi:MAG: hypothetical protein QNK37_08720 [Acidobacteriota bacterium]|nr:hypothetical protein [Acidobacteriota bacterium]
MRWTIFLLTLIPGFATGPLLANIEVSIYVKEEKKGMVADSSGREPLELFSMELMTTLDNDPNIAAKIWGTFPPEKGNWEEVNEAEFKDLADDDDAVKIILTCKLDNDDEVVVNGVTEGLGEFLDYKLFAQFKTDAAAEKKGIEKAVDFINVYKNKRGVDCCLSTKQIDLDDAAKKILTSQLFEHRFADMLGEGFKVQSAPCEKLEESKATNRITMSTTKVVDNKCTILVMIEKTNARSEYCSWNEITVNEMGWLVLEDHHLQEIVDHIKQLPGSSGS